MGFEAYKKVRATVTQGMSVILTLVFLLGGLLGVHNKAMAAPVSVDNTAYFDYTTTGMPPYVNEPSNPTSYPLVALASTPSTLVFYKYSPTGQCAGTPGNPVTAPSFPFAGGRYEDTTGTFQNLPLPQVFTVDPSTNTYGYSPLTNLSNVSVCPTTVFHGGEPVFITLEDQDRNLDPTGIDVIRITIKSNTEGVADEVLELRETGPNTGIFSAVIQSTTDPVTSGDGKISVSVDDTIRGHYKDPVYGDESSNTALVDPFGILFDTSDNSPINGAQIWVVDINKPGCSAVTSHTDAGLMACLADVLQDDGVTTHPATMTTGTTVPGNPAVPAGGFRFPLMSPGDYRFILHVPGYTVPSSVVPVGGTAPGRSIVLGSHLQDFVVLPGPALNIDIPADPSQQTLLLTKEVSRSEASTGDYLQYRLSLTNNGPDAMTATTVQDVLPLGMRYQSGSLHINGVQQPDPAIAADGRTMTITLPAPLQGSAATPANKALMTYVVAVAASATPGDAVNTARASGPTGVGPNGSLVSNRAQVAVRIRDFLNSGRFTIIGRVFENDCTVPFAEQKGVPNVRLLMEDGTYVVTDKDGQYHFEGVKPGTHVVQIDTISLPKDWETVSCIENTRFAGSSYSQFVDVKGGGLWRADFHVRPKAKLAELVPEPEVIAEKPVIPSGEAGIRLQTLEDVQVVEMTKELPPRSYTFNGRFASGDDVLLPASIQQLEKLANDLKKGRVLRLEVLGHTDSQGLSARAKAKFTDNYGLGLARATTIANYLAARLGLSEEQIKVEGVGPDRPIASNNTAAGMARNRRVDVIVVGAMGPATEKVGERSRRQHRVIVDSGKVAAFNLRASVTLPADLAYVKGSTQLDGESFSDPELINGQLHWAVPAPAEKPKKWEDIQAEAENGVSPKTDSIAWQRIITFNTDVVRKTVTTKPAADKEYTFNGRFEPAQAELMHESVDELEQLQETLRQAGKIERLEIIGHTDNQGLSARARKRFPDNKALSLARARTIANFLQAGLALADNVISVDGKGPDEPVASNKTQEGMAKNRRVEVKVFTREAAQSRLQRVCHDGFVSLSASAILDTQTEQDIALPTVENRLPCGDQNTKSPAGSPKTSGSQANATTTAQVAAAPADTSTSVAPSSVMNMAPANAAEAESGRQSENTVKGNDSGRQTVVLKPYIPEPAENAVVDNAATSAPSNVSDLVAHSEPASNGKTEPEEQADVDWLSRAEGNAANGFLFPNENYNPRIPALRVAIQHGAFQRVELLVNNEPVSPLNFDGVNTDKTRDAGVSTWRAVPLREGPNRIMARIYDQSGIVVADLVRVVNYANTPARAELVLAKSKLVADGITRPVLAVRIMDVNGNPVRDGVTGSVNIRSPYMSWQQQQETQRRQLAGLDAFQPQYRIQGDEGIAYIELAPTTESGMAYLDFEFLSDTSNTRRKQELHAYLEPAAREWVMVGFAEGTVGYNTLKDNVAALQAQGVEEGTYTDGQISFYAKGSVLGKWILTMAYDSDKERDRQSLLSTIDPNEYYTLYGDGTEQRYDAASQSKLYLKLERGQFYALFGDYDTGLSANELSRYNRTMNGLKAEKADGLVVFTAYAAEVGQNHARDEIRGNGTSGLYRLNQKGIVLNSEQVRIETRDRLHSQNILETRTLLRHIDYDIDYSNGTIFFKQPVFSQDSNFNPIWIVASYETLGTATEALNLGGRIGLRLQDGKLNVGVTALRDEAATAGSQDKTDLMGADLKYRFGIDSEFRLELANTSGDAAGVAREGKAWLAELEHHTGRYDLLLYARNQETGFGVSQQNLSEAGQEKIGVNSTIRLDREWSLLTELFHQENLTNNNERIAASARIKYEIKDGSASLGVQAINDKEDSTGNTFKSEQLVVGANRWFMKRKLELNGQAEVGSSDSGDYPNRLTLGANYVLTENIKLLAGQEFTDGSDLKTSNSRVGMQVIPWKGARLDSTLNQSQMSEFGPRTFAQFGLVQTLQLNKQWGVDFGIDSAQSIGNKSARPEINNSQATNNILGLGASRVTALTEDFFAASVGATYRTDIWSWTNRLEWRDGSTEDRYGLTSNFLRQARDGVAFATGFQAFNTKNTTSNGNLVSLDLSWAWRPLGTQWSILDRLEFKYEDAESTTALPTPPPGGLFGFDSLVANNAKSRRVINNLALNRVSKEWTEEDRQGNLFRRYERNQWMLYYGSKYVMDTFDGIDYSGYTDMLAAEWRYDVRPWLDLGIQASTLNSWSTHTRSYSFGPQVGVSPVRNGWVTLGWNLRGFTDRDFSAARYSAQGPYLQLRIKFDQNTRLNSDSHNTNASSSAEPSTNAQE